MLSTERKASVNASTPMKKTSMNATMSFSTSLIIRISQLYFGMVLSQSKRRNQIMMAVAAWIFQKYISPRPPVLSVFTITKIGVIKLNSLRGE